jgi:hypothetical protein
VIVAEKKLFARNIQRDCVCFETDSLRSLAQVPQFEEADLAVIRAGGHFYRIFGTTSEVPAGLNL